MAARSESMRPRSLFVHGPLRGQLFLIQRYQGVGFLQLLQGALARILRLQFCGRKQTDCHDACDGVSKEFG